MERYKSKFKENPMQQAKCKSYILKSSITDDDLYNILTFAGHQVLLMKNDKGLLADYLAGVLEGTIRG